MIIGYARVSTEDQKLDMQVQALENAGCDRIFSDHGQSGADFERSGLDEALQALKPGDSLVVWRLDRLGRSLTGLVGLMSQLGERGVNFRSVTESIDTTSSGGKLMFHMMAALAEFERSLISERTRAGMAAAKERGSQLGRPKAVISQDQVRSALCALQCPQAQQRQVADELGVSVRTLQRRISTFIKESDDCSCSSRMRSAGPSSTKLHTSPVSAEKTVAAISGSHAAAPSPTMKSCRTRSFSSA